MNLSFNLPTGEVELKLKEKDNSLHWVSVAFTDNPSEKEIADLVKRWSANHEVLAVRYNGWDIPMPKIK